MGPTKAFIAVVVKRSNSRNCGDTDEEVVAKQVACGIDVVSDGEMSKPSYTTYIRHRVAGIAPDPRAAEKGRDIMIGRDLLAHPDFANRRGNFSDTPFPGCVGPLRYKDRR